RTRRTRGGARSGAARGGPRRGSPSGTRRDTRERPGSPRSSRGAARRTSTDSEGRRTSRAPPPLPRRASVRPPIPPWSLLLRLPSRPWRCVLAGALALLQHLLRLVREVGDRDALPALLVVEVDLATVAFELRELWDHRRVAKLDERLDRRGDDFAVLRLEEPRDELRAARLRDLGEEERQLREHGGARGHAAECPLDPERDLLEAIVGESFERLAGDEARLGRRPAHDVDEEIDDVPALEVAEHEGEP